ncbi:hypothetical protein AURDEDRAFT_111223 [Auricularia subglabra TFB-10046 SS5]|nr:hypothetical protein AURDEDRAFT_111223 [Auricularia subglabra TFB-10046 SS5]
MTTHISVLPREVINLVTSATESSGLRFVRLPHPRTNVPCLFLPYQTSTESGVQSAILEVQAVSPDCSRSWFLNDTHVIEDGKMLLYTPIDPVFLLAPLLQLTAGNDGSMAQFRPAEDIFEDIASRISITADTATTDSTHGTPNQDIYHLQRLPCVHEALRRICEYKELTEDLTVYRFTQQHLLNYIREKVVHLSSPAVFDGFIPLVRGLAKDGLKDAPESKREIASLARTRAACELLSQYLPEATYQALLSSFDFTVLSTYIATLEADNTAMLTKTTPAAPAAPKGTKRKATKQASRGVETLKKVNTTGMGKMTSFFAKK